MDDSELISNVLSGDDLFVVLENEFGPSYVESYPLTTIFIRNSRFWGKFPNIHSPRAFSNINPQASLSYIYNNYLPIVCTSSLRDSIVRFVSSKSYRTVSFNTKSKYREVWNNDRLGNVNLIEEGVRSGLRFKLIFTDVDDTIFVLPIHTIEVSTERGYVGFETQFDGFPQILFNDSSLDNLVSSFDRVCEDRETSSYPTSPIYKDQPYVLTSFFSDGENFYRRFVAGNGRLSNTTQVFQSLNLMMECG